MFTEARVVVKNSGEAASHTSKEPPGDKLRPGVQFREASLRRRELTDTWTLVLFYIYCFTEF